MVTGATLQGASYGVSNAHFQSRSRSLVHLCSPRDGFRGLALHRQFRAGEFAGGIAIAAAVCPKTFPPFQARRHAVPKKVVVWRIGNLQRWLRAHIWLTLLTIPLVILHSGFRLGGPMTTLIIVLYLVVMVSGIYGLVLQHYVPTVMMERLPAESVYEQIPHIRAQILAAAIKMRDSFKPAPPTKPDAGGAAPSPAKVVTAGSSPIASTAADLSTPTARAKSVVGSTITAETIVAPEKKQEEKVPPPRPLDAKPPETMGTPTARVPEGAA